MAKLSATTVLIVFLSISLCHGTKLVVEEKEAPKLPTPMLAHLRFYLQENLTGPNPTKVKIAGPSSDHKYNSSTRFGLAYTFDNPLTIDPETTADVMGRAQGFYTFSSNETLAFTMMMTMEFDGEKKFNGSKLVIVGKVDAADPNREIPIVGGTGVFRYASGYATLTGYYTDAEFNNNIILYNVYVRY